MNEAKRPFGRFLFYTRGLMNELEALVALSAIPFLGPIRIRQLIHHFGSSVAAYQGDRQELEHIPGFGEKILQAWEIRHRDSQWKKEFDLALLYGVTLLPFTSPSYPKHLLQIPDAPILLYLKGNSELLHTKGIAIVGTRNCTIYGKEMAETFGKELASFGFTVISGLARGIDTAAHQGALITGQTLAVIGSGFAHIYPKENLLLAKTIEYKGLLISEFSIQTTPQKQNFPRRNRIVSALATSGILLIEAPLKSGAMITVDIAVSQGRKIFAIPGRADHENFQGNHLLIKKGIATLVDRPSDITELSDTPMTKSQLTSPKIPLNEEESLFISQLPDQEFHFDQIAMKLQNPTSKIHTLLMNLILKKYIKEFPGNFFKKIM